MATFLLSLASEFWPYILAAGGVVLALFQQSRVRAANDRAKDAQRDKEALGEQLEMHREATQAERDAAALSDDEARKEAAKWARR